MQIAGRPQYWIYVSDQVPAWVQDWATHKGNAGTNELLKYTRQNHSHTLASRSYTYTGWPEKVSHYQIIKKFC